MDLIRLVAEFTELRRRLLTSAGLVRTERLGSGTADGTTFLRGDATWAVPSGGGGGGVSDGDKGDIVVSASGATWTIDAAAVGTSKLGGDITTAGKALLDDADAAAQRVTLGAAAASHTHAQADVTNLVTDLAGKAATSHTHAAADIASGTIATARLGSGTANSTTYLRGDQTWATVTGGLTAPQVASLLSIRF